MEMFSAVRNNSFNVHSIHFTVPRSIQTNGAEQT